jgi:hypothetical protein
MKAIIIAALIAVALTAPTLKEVDGKIKFEYDAHPDLPIGISLSGEVDPRAENSNKISAFLKLANQFIPLLEAVNQESKLEWYGYTCFGGEAFNGCTYYGYLLTVGWRVQQGGVAAGAYNITYVPFAEGWASANVSVSSWPVLGGYQAYASLVRAYAPIGV